MYRRAEACQRHALSTPATAAALALFVAVSLLRPSDAHACSCLRQSPQEAYEQAVSVFEGHVLEISPAPATEASALPQLAVKMAVVRSWKGMEQEQVVLTTASDSAMCGFAFEVDQDYLVYAASGTSGLSVSLCSRTALVGAAGEDLQVLGMGATPVSPRLPKGEQEALAQPKPEPPRHGGCASCAVVPARQPTRARAAWLAGVCVGFGVAVRVRRRRLNKT
jgi:hypothetical protein